MEYRRRSLGLREYSPGIELSGGGGESSFSSGNSFTSLSSGSSSPVLSRRRSASPLYSAFTGSNCHLNSIHRNRKDPSFPQTEDEHLYLFHERIIWNQEKSLLPMAHDLADWIGSLLQFNLLPGTLMSSLETGEILYKLAKLIESKAQLTPLAKVKPKLRGKMRANARKGSFFARDNIAMFIAFCKDLGVHSNLIFETEDLVSHGEIRNILICLMEVGRLSVQYGVEPPALVAFEQQIDREAIDNRSQRTTTTDEDEPFTSDEANKENPKPKNNIARKGIPNSRIPIFSTSSRLRSNLLSDSMDSGLAETGQPVSLSLKTQLDLKVSEVARISGKHCCCIEETRKDFKLRKLSEGKYLINGRTVFVRLLKGIHVMVRVGGGWETLEEFLVRNDPCRGHRGSVGVRGDVSGAIESLGCGGDGKRRSSFGDVGLLNRSYTSSPSHALLVKSALSTPVSPGAHSSSSNCSRRQPLLQRPLSTPPTSLGSNLRLMRSRPSSYSACATPTIPSKTHQHSRHSSRNSLVI